MPWEKDRIQKINELHGKYRDVLPSSDRFNLMKRGIGSILKHLKEAIEDDALRDEVLSTCPDEGHDDRWCSYCAAREDGIDAYRELLLKRLGFEPWENDRSTSC